MVKDIIIEGDQVKGVITDKNETYYAPEVVPPSAARAPTGSAISAAATALRRKSVPWISASV